MKSYLFLFCVVAYDFGWASIPKPKAPSCPRKFCGGYVSCPKALEKKPIPIRTMEDLRKVESRGHYKLEKDIMLAPFFLSLGKHGQVLTDVFFDGNGHTIQNLNNSLFDEIESSVITNLRLSHAKISQQTTGGVAVKTLGQNTCLDNVHTTKHIIYGSHDTGGLVGTFMGPFSAIFNSSADGVVNTRGGKTKNFGGLIGLLSLSDPGPNIILNSSTSGKVLTYDAHRAGGVVGQVQVFHRKASVEFQGVTTRTYVEGRKYVGGLIGSIETGQDGYRGGWVHISDSKTEGEVRGRSWEDPTQAAFSIPSEFIGGFVGYIETGEIVDSRSEGLVSGRKTVGGFLGGYPDKKCMATNPCKVINSHSSARVTTEKLSFHEKVPALAPASVGIFEGMEYLVTPKKSKSKLSRLKK